MEELSEEGTHKEINSYFFMGVLILEVLLEIIARDGMLAIFSLVFVFIWLRINTRSWFLSGIGILVSKTNPKRVGDRQKEDLNHLECWSALLPFSHDMTFCVGNFLFDSDCLVLLFGCLPNQIFCFSERSQHFYCSCHWSR